jgi:hypothetical protein
LVKEGLPDAQGTLTLQNRSPNEPSENVSATSIARKHSIGNAEAGRSGVIHDNALRPLRIYPDFCIGLFSEPSKDWLKYIRFVN